MSSVAPFKGIPEISECGIENPLRVTQHLRLSYLPLHWGEFSLLAARVGCPVLVLELKSCMLCPSCDIEIPPGPPR